MAETPTDNLIKQMFEVGAHFGSIRSRRHPSTKDHILGAKGHLEIIDLKKTTDFLELAKKFVAELGATGKKILFVGNKNEARKIVEEAAKSLGMPYVTERWLGGTLTNFEEIKKRTARLEEIEEKKEKGQLSIYTKKEQNLIKKELADLKRFFQGIVKMKELPSAIFVVDSDAEHTAVSEAQKKEIPIVSISNSDCDLSKINYPILANDRAKSSIQFFVDEIAEAYKEGQRKTPAKEAEQQKDNQPEDKKADNKEK